MIRPVSAKIVLAITAMFAILFGVAIQLRSASVFASLRPAQSPDIVQSIPKPAPEPVKLFDTAWQDTALQKSDRLRVVSTESQPVVTERVVAVLRDDSVIVPPVVERPVLDKPLAEKRGRHTSPASLRLRSAPSPLRSAGRSTSAAEPEICVRYGMHRVYRPDGKSWRCRR